VKLSRSAIALALVLVAGAAYRLAHLASRPSLDVDEAMLVLNIGSRSYAQLLEPLHYNQLAPVPYRWALRLATDLGGVNDVALRVPSLLAGLLLPLVVWRVARRLLEPGPAVFAAALAALSPILIAFSVTAKQYIVDALVTVWLVDLTLSVIERPERRAAWLRLVLGGAVAVLCSMTAVFVLCGVGAALVLAPPLRARPGTRVRVVLGIALWAGVFAAVYARFYGPAAAVPYVREFWEATFLTPASLGSHGPGWKILERFWMHAFVSDRVASNAAYVLWLLALAGIVQLVRSRGAFAAALVAGPVMAVLVASGIERYPIAPRLLLFVAPLVSLLVAAGVSRVLDWGPARAAVPVVWTCAGLGLAALAMVDLRWGVHAAPTRPLIEELQRRRDAREPVFSYTGAAPAWLFYATDWHAPDTAVLYRLFRATGPGGLGFHNRASRGRPVAADEGTDLVVSARGRVELFGLATGMQWREGRGFSQERPDSGWAEREAERIRRATDSTAWVFIADPYPNTAFLLGRALSRQRGKPQLVREGAGAYLYRYRFRAVPPEAS